MLAKLTAKIPVAGDYLFEPKWDGFRSIVFRGEDGTYLQSRDRKPLDRYFPELHEALAAGLPAGCVVDGEVVIETDRGLDFDLLQMRIHPAESRVAMLAETMPSSFVAFDLLAVDGEDLMAHPQEERRVRLEALLDRDIPSVRLTPVTRDRDVATRWFERFEGAGLDGVIAKPAAGTYQPGKRTMLKIKHSRTADCVVAGFRWYKRDPGVVGSLLLGLFDDAGRLQHVGVTSSFSMARRKELAVELEPLREGALADHPWGSWAEADPKGRMPGAQSRWSGGKDHSWEPLRIERVCEVKYDHMQRDRFRHATTFLRWRADKAPEDCTYEQLDEAAPYDLEKIFAV